MARASASGLRELSLEFLQKIQYHHQSRIVQLIKFPQKPIPSKNTMKQRKHWLQFYRMTLGNLTPPPLDALLPTPYSLPP